MDNTENQLQIQENQPNYFDTLCDEVLLIIFQKVPKLDLEPLALVCRRYNCIIADRSLWRKVVVVGRELTPDFLETLMRRQVENLYLFRVKIPPPELRPAFEATQSSLCLKEVTLRYVQTSPDNLVQMFSKCKQLRKVKLTCVGVNNDVFAALSENKNIEILFLRELQGVEPFGFKIFLQNVRKLQVFHMQGDCVNTTPLYWRLIFDSICENLPPSLLHLTFHGYINGSLLDQHIEHIVKNCPLLQSLNPPHGFTLTAISAESLQGLQHLRTLQMVDCKPISREARLSLTKMQSLEELRLYFTGSDRERRCSYIEKRFEVNIIEDHYSWRVGTFQSAFRVVKIIY